MTGSKSSNDPEPHHSSEHDSGEDSEDESEILEESPCGRWQKRREEIQQRDIPGIDNAFLAMDTEEGVEVVWNEVQFSEKRNFKAQQEKIKHVFDNLIQLEHPNIVKFHKYWTDKTMTDKPRVIFITEYMSSGSLKQFLKKTKKNAKTLKAWHRWTTQILSALSYLHSCDPPIIHGNLSCDTIFIQHNGLIKIGSVAPDAIHNHVKTCRSSAKNIYYIAPEYGGSAPVTTAVDIYSFGICALEMATLHIHGNGDGGGYVTEDSIIKTLDLIDDPSKRDFIAKCLSREPGKRPTARDLLFHPVLFEVHSLKILSAHCFINYSDQGLLPEHVTNAAHDTKDPNKVIAEVKRLDSVQWKISQVPSLDLEKFLEDVRNGSFPLTAFEINQPSQPRPRAISPEVAESVKSDTPEPLEGRHIVNICCTIRQVEGSVQLNLVMRMDDKMNRQLTCEVSDEDSSHALSDELVYYGFINDTDREKVAHLIDETRRNYHTSDSKIVTQSA
ncbi:nuclear receptor-binding protein-like [Tubulanus polymorphus]|uniref:nuclear receptor-binding protein-like n=1 Tax=Tubulanus polymorphus TaxID=672921 RepID=UPI003DA65A01